MSMTTQFRVEKMMCSGCVSNVEKALQDINGIEAVDVNLEQKMVTVSGDFEDQAIADLMSKSGYPASIIS